MFDLSLIETDSPMPESMDVLKCISETQLARGCEVQPTQELTDELNYTPSEPSNMPTPRMP